MVCGLLGGRYKIMDFEELYRNLAGEWKGENLLRLSWMTPPEHVSPAGLFVIPAAKEKFLSFNYTWIHENIPQEGIILVGFDTQQNLATGAWIDSWHQSIAVMFCRGTIGRDGTIDLRGTYAAPPDPDWRWRIVITTPSISELRIEMYNCSPEGAEDLAVRAEYKRV